MKTRKCGRWVFQCDKCSREVGVSHRDERTTRQIAMRDGEGWEWNHPDWDLLCPRCQEK